MSKVIERHEIVAEMSLARDHLADEGERHWAAVLDQARALIKLQEHALTMVADWAETSSYDDAVASLPRIAGIARSCLHGGAVEDRQDGVALLTAEVDRLTAEVGRLRGGVQAVLDGHPDVQPRAEAWFEDGRLSKHDKCPHGVFMYDACGACADEFLERVLAGDWRPLPAPPGGEG